MRFRIADRYPEETSHGDMLHGLPGNRSVRSGLLYLSFLTTGLLILFSAALWMVSGHVIPGVGAVAIHVFVFGFATAAVLGLIALRPRRAPFALGALCVLLALVGFWIASPDGRQLIFHALGMPARDAYPGSLPDFSFLLFPVGWVLLGASVVNWRIGLLSYLLCGLVFLALTLVAGLIGPLGYGPGRTPPLVPVALVLLWPEYAMVMLGIFGYTFG